MSTVPPDAKPLDVFGFVAKTLLERFFSVSTELVDQFAQQVSISAWPWIL
jgi:hypothetical protein